MRFYWIIGLVLVLSITFSSTSAARRLKFRPLSADEVYQILKDAGREDAIPEGRVVTQGIAALSGFALGLKKGVAVPLAIGLATSNITQDFINNINNINYTALANSLPTIPPITFPTINYTALASSLPTIPPITLPTINYTAIANSFPTINMTALMSIFRKTPPQTQYTTQEICFSSRSLDQINDDSEDYNDYDTPQGRQTPTGTLPPPPPATTQPAPPTTSPVTTPPDGTGTGGTGTDTATTTETGSNGSVNCIILEKPVSG